MKRFQTWRAWVVGATVAGCVTVVVLAVRFGPTITLSLSLAFPATEAWLAPLLQTAVREEVSIATRSRPLAADLYRPPRSRAALLLVHGLSRAGRRHPELARLANLLARHGHLVLVPEFAGLTAFRLSGAEVDEIREAIRYLKTLSGAVGVAGFSFGAGPALLAAADFSDLWLVASFGGYADLGNVIAYITTGIHSFGGRRYVQRQEEYNRWKLLALLAGSIESERDRNLVGAIAERRLSNPATDTAGLEERLGPEGHAVLRLSLNRDERGVTTLLADLPPRSRQKLALLSPLEVASRLCGRLLIVHGASDDSIPFTESLRLAEATGGRARLTILHTFHHTGPQVFWRSLRDRAEDTWSLLLIADDLLRMTAPRTS
jgi:fermentation-respiration switch protein FrsA (DUF1100 family)